MSFSIVADGEGDAATGDGLAVAVGEVATGVGEAAIGVGEVATGDGLAVAVGVVFGAGLVATPLFQTNSNVPWLQLSLIFPAIAIMQTLQRKIHLTF